MLANRYRIADVQWVLFDLFEDDYRGVIKPNFQKGPDSLKYDVLELIELYCGMDGHYAVPHYKTRDGQWYHFIFSFDLDEDDMPIIQYSHCQSSS